MAECDELFDRINKKAENVFSRIPKECQKTLEWLDTYRQEILTKIIQAQNKKYKLPILPKTPSRNKRAKRRVISSTDEDDSLSKVDNQSSIITDNSIFTIGKPKRNASKLAEQKIVKQSQLKLNSKMRRPEKDDSVLHDISNNGTHLNIKSEKKSASAVQETETQIELKPELENVKKENMPPPAAKPKRVRKKIKKEVDSSDTENEGAVRVTRSKRTVTTLSTASTRSTRSTRTTSKTRNDSDVILQEIPVPIVFINDSDSEDTENQINAEVENSKQVEDTPGENDENQPPISIKIKKKTKKPTETKTKKTQKVKVAETNEDSVYEDALPAVKTDDVVAKDNNNKVLSSMSKETAKIMNCTVTLEKITLNDTHVLQDNVKTSTLNVTRVIENCVPTLNETHIIPKDKNQVLETQKGVLLDCSVVLQKMNETVTLSKNNAIANQTVVLTLKENEHQWQKADVPLPVDNLLTDDDDSIVKSTPVKNPEPPRKGIKTKQMFSPYANSPVKKRVAAFEKLVASDVVDMPTRVTRTKTKKMEKDKEIQTISESSSRIPAKSKYYTPTANNKLPSLIPQSDSKAYRTGTAGNKNTSVLPTKSASVMKPSRVDVQLRREEEQKRRLEKEEDAKRKREALMYAKAEEQRKKREEKQMKAQKAREEMEREKEEKLRQFIQEKEEEQQKKREWQTKKQAEIEERKKAEEQIKLLKQREQERQRQLEEKRRRQLAMKPPPLPTEDCDDSDSSTDTVTKKYEKPEWAQSKYLCRSLLIQRYISKPRIEALFQMEATTPDLREIFETVDERLLRRNSSAVWRTPPRYSTLPKF